MERCFIALGSNLDQPLQQVNDAIQELASLPDTSLVAISPWYQSTAIGPGKQPDYINGVAELKCNLQPLALLDQLQAIENKHQRKRIQRWGPRTLDLDLLLYGSIKMNTPRLQLPHPRLHERNFVLYPLHDIAPDYRLPSGDSVKNLLKQCTKEGLRLAD